MKERKLGLAKRLSAFALAFVMVFSLLATFNVSALAADEDVAPTLNPGWTYDEKDYDLIMTPGEAAESNYTVYYYATDDEDDEPDAPSSKNLGAWTWNWRDDNMFLQKDAGEYYVWWCVYDAEEDEFSTRPELVGSVEVDKATITGTNPRGTTVEYINSTTPQLLFEKAPGDGIYFVGVADDLDNTKYYYAVTDQTVTDPSKISKSAWTDTVEEVNKTDVGKYRVWYQLKNNNNREDADNYEDAEIGYVDSEITAKSMAAVGTTQSTAADGVTPIYYTGEFQGFDEIKVTNSVGEVLPATVTYGTSQAKATEPIGTVNNALQEANKCIKAGTYTIFYTATLEGYDPIEGKITKTISKAHDEIDETNEEYCGGNLTGDVIALPARGELQLVTGSATAEKEEAWKTDVYYAVNTTGRVPSTSSTSGWYNEEQLAKTIVKKADKYYVYRMATTTTNTLNVEASPVTYKVITVGTETESDANVTLAGNVPYDGDSHDLLNLEATSYTGAGIQFNVTTTPNMPSPTDSGWTTLGTNVNIKRTDVGKYYVWYRSVEGANGATKYAESTPTCGEPFIIEKVTASGQDGYVSPVATAMLSYSGKNQSLLETEGEAPNDLYWYYVVTNSDEIPVYMGTSVPKMKNCDTYTTTAYLIDPSTTKNYKEEVYSLEQPLRLKVASQALGKRVVKIVTENLETTIIPYIPEELVDPELVSEDLEYTGEAQSLIETYGSVEKGNLYYIVQDEEGGLVSLDGTATNAGDYTVYTFVTDLSTMEIALKVLEYGKDFAFPVVISESNVYGKLTPVGTATIEPANPTVLGILPSTSEWDGYMHELCTEGITDGGRIYYMAYDENNKPTWKDWTRVVPRAEDMGEYTIVYKVELPDWETNYNEVEETELAEKAQIAAGLAEVTVAPEGINGYANGEAQALATAGEAKDGTMVYALGTELMPVSEWSLEIPTATEAGEYHVWYKAMATESEYGDSEQHVTKATLSEQALLYRIFNPATGEHLYTFDANEVEVQTTVGGWTLDGTVPAPTDGTVTVYRLLDLVHGVHIYTTDENEIAELVAAGVAELEGPAFDSIPESDTALTYYRLSSAIVPHHYTADQNEIASLVASGVYTLDGPVWYFPQ